MLSRQSERPHFLGGLEAALMTADRATQLRQLKPKSMYFAYDTPDDLEPLIQAGNYLLDAGFTKASHVLKCYVLIGFPGDSFDKATKRIMQAWNAGFLPMAMLYRDKAGVVDQEWRRFQRQYARHDLTYNNCKNNERTIKT